MLRIIERAAQRILSQGIAFAFAGLVMFAGAAFIVASGFLVLEAELGAPLACLITGLLLMVVGALVLLIMRPQKHARHHQEQEPDITVGVLIDAFIAGMKAGRK
jgi:hypothetical protein